MYINTFNLRLFKDVVIEKKFLFYYMIFQSNSYNLSKRIFKKVRAGRVQSPADFLASILYTQE